MICLHRMLLRVCCIVALSWVALFCGDVQAKSAMYTLRHPLQTKLAKQSFKKIAPRLIKHVSEVLWLGLTKRKTVLSTLRIYGILEATHPLSKDELARLEALGVSLSPHHTFGHFYPATISRVDLFDKIDALPFVKRLESGGAHKPVHHPLAQTTDNIEAPAVYQTFYKDVPVRGKGVIIGSLDSGIDLFHPVFFRADGGLFSWIDVNKDGVFTPCTDAVDLNKDGSAQDDETLCCLQARKYNRSSFNPIDPTPGPNECRAGTDWLFHDQNKNNQRDFGAPAFRESDPTFGEQFFIIDDINKNGKLDVGEKIIGLKTSKIKATFIDGVERVRGKDLILTKVKIDASGSNAMHGTGSSSVMVGGHPGLTKLTGIAPDAELVISNSRAPDAQGRLVAAQAQAMAFLKKHGAQVAIHEYSLWFGRFLDGSSALEKIIAQAGKDGMIQVCPTGNLRGSKKHFLKQIPAKSTITLPIHVEPNTAYRINEYRTMLLTLLWNKQPGAALKFTLTTPQGKAIPLSDTNKTGRFLEGGTGLYLLDYKNTSDRGTVMQDVTLYNYQTSTQQFGSIPNGKWTLTIEGDPNVDVLLHGYIADEASSWVQGIYFSSDVVEDYLAAWPSTADHCIGVGAYTGRDDKPHSPGPEVQGQLRGYSSGGPRIDGEPIVWITAPDNPETAVSRLNVQGRSWIGHGHTTIYGGTSGASPHVAAAMGLLKQLHPDWDQQQALSALKKNAYIDSFVKGDVQNLPDKRWGYGKLRIYKLLYEKDRPENTAPQISYEHTGLPNKDGGAYQFVLGHLPDTLTVKVSDKEDKTETLKVSWDPEYDGVWNITNTKHQFPFPLKGKGDTASIKVRVVDSAGASSSTLLSIEVVACQDDTMCQEGFMCKEGSCVEKPKPEPTQAEPTQTEPTQTEPTVDGGVKETATGGDTGGPNKGCGCQATSNSVPVSMVSLCLLAFVFVSRRKRP